MIPVNEPVISEEAKNNVIQALETGWLSSAGPFVTQFETNFANYLGVKHAVTVNTGTAALHIALLASGVGKDDEVIVPAFTMAATWLAVLYVGATPVFVDCEPYTYNIDPALVEEKITSRTKAIIPVHIYGHPVDMDPVLELANKHNLVVIEDAAEAHGAEYKGRKCGSMGHINCFSFYANKLITTGEGGMIVTDDDALADEARKYKDLYHSPAKRFIHEKIGYNYRLTNLQAAVGCGELAHIDEYIAKKRWMADRYNQGLRSIPGITLPVEKPYAKSVYWMYAVVVDRSSYGMSKDELRQALKEKGIDTRDFFYSPTQQPVLKGIVSSKTYFPVTDRIAQDGLYLPSGLATTKDQINSVVEEVRRLSKNNLLTSLRAREYD